MQRILPRCQLLSPYYAPGPGKHHIALFNSHVRNAYYPTEVTGDNNKNLSKRLNTCMGSTVSEGAQNDTPEVSAHVLNHEVKQPPRQDTALHWGPAGQALKSHNIKIIFLEVI
jgi:hypothetical protein